MDDLANIFFLYRWQIAGTLPMAFIVYYLADLNNRRNRLADVSKQFRIIIYAELKGIYPSIELHLSPEEINAKILQSIPNIQLAVSNFKSFVPFYRKRRFDKAAQNYYKTARKTDWNEVSAQKRFPVTFPGPNKIEMEFKHCVKNLLSYANEK